MTSRETRSKFLAFFEERSHRSVPSSSLVPENDPTLLFTNAGMNQFKDVFLGREKRDYARACSSQKCVRAGGKHNDLENIGRTRRHHTFFEMLGNFSFGPSSVSGKTVPDLRRGYFKREIVCWAWELLTRDFGLPADRLWVTVFREDDEAAEFWRKDVGLPADRIHRGDEKDNFWAMGETGPCGPCSEIHYDLGPAGSDLGHKECNFPCPEDCGRYVEIWNLVFMQFNRSEDGKMEPLPSPSIDTGMGLERVAAILQGKISNFDTDLFRPLIEEAAELAGVEYGAEAEKDVSLRIVADHARAAAFLIPDGVLPANEGRGYVLRKILRRAIRHGRMLGLEDPFLYKLAGSVSYQMKEAYPELVEAEERMAGVVKGEEQRFSQTLLVALEKLDQAVRALPKRYAGLKLKELPDGTSTIRASSIGNSSEAPILAGDVAFKLYDTFGLPLDLLQDEGSFRGFGVDVEGFNKEMAGQRTRARASWKGKAAWDAPVFWQELQSRIGETKFLGYEVTEAEQCNPLALIPRRGEQSETLDSDVEAEIVLHRTPFYAEAGGQVGDQGVLVEAESGQVVADVLDTYAPVQGFTVHKIRTRATVRKGAPLTARVNGERRDHIRRNHTATHLMHAALRGTLGTHVKQKGSLVAPDRLRFDFSHYKRMEDEELREIEDLVNRRIRSNEAVGTEETDRDSAVQSGAMAFFGEKYPDKVRVVSVGDFSK
ncbi:MAG: alanine--tRNA ligase, partial [Acidobacteria bacterium]|nr:alanine--tRNA ligase [Acidobacteriota bacterium]